MRVAITSATLILMLMKSAPARVLKDEKIVIVLQNQIAVFKTKTPIPITKTPEPKYTPVWSPNGSEIAFLDDTRTNVRLPELVIISETGHVRLRTQLYPDQSPGESVTAIVPRSLGILTYLNGESLLIEGSLNRWVCDFIFVDPRNGKIDRDMLGQCGTLSMSPDQKHALVEDNRRASSAEYWRDGIGLDGANLYPSGTSKIRLLSISAWSPDSKSIGVVERDVETGARDIVIIEISGSVSHAALPNTFGRPTPDTIDEIRPVIVGWANGHFVAEDGTVAFEAIPGQPVATEAGPEVRANLDEERVRSTQAATTRRSKLEKHTGIRDALDAVYDIWPETKRP